jgi:radical SAM protein with 4Fe4S-binding SPASM domain
MGPYDCMGEVCSLRIPTVPDPWRIGPTYVVWELTLRCNQACRFCGSRAGAARRNELSTQECRDVIAQLAQMGVREISLHGGEAYLRPDWLEIVRMIRSHGIAASLVTGGRGLDADMARDARAAGISAVSVSVDGLPATHDGLRGVSGSHAAALGAMRHLLDAGVRVGCITQLNQRNFRELPGLTQLLAQYPLYGWQVQLMIPMGRAADHEDLWLQPHDMLELLPKVAEARRRCDQLGIALWAGDNVGYFGPFEHLLRYERSPSGHCGGCGGGVVTLGLEAHGDIKGCSAMGDEADFVGGNVRTSRLREVWDHAPELLHARCFKISDLWGYCRDCYYGNICRAGCVWTAKTLLGKHGNNPYCHHRALEMLRTGQRERLRRTGRAPGEVRDRAWFELTVEEAPSDWASRMRELTERAVADLVGTPHRSPAQVTAAPAAASERAEGVTV